MIEKDYYAAVSRFYTRNSGMSMAIEVKITKAKALPFRCLLPHQEENLLQSERTFAYKIPDAGMGRKPYDIMLVHRARAVIVAVYYRPRDAGVYEIPLRAWIEERESTGEKSLNEQRARLIGKVLLLKRGI
jgi:hypothetical protein